jgi:EAL domain-containing protein (putative c-di-GMP-specific phosphodiesterase class I)
VAANPAGAAVRPEQQPEAFVDVPMLLRENAVTLDYQPIVELATDTVVAVEALARFAVPGGPMAVLTAAEQQGLTAEVEALIIRRALLERLRVPAGMLLTLNVSPHMLLVGPVRELVESAELHGIVFELTEHSVPPEPADLMPIIDGMRSRGALIALDDAGAGYQGIKQVASLRPDWVKVDRSVVTGVATDEVRRASLVMFDRVARRVGAVTVAEGVETAEDLAALRELEIPLAQGFWLGTPSMHPRLRKRG